MLVSLPLYFLGGWGQSPQRKCLGQLTSVRLLAEV